VLQLPLNIKKSIALFSQPNSRSDGFLFFAKMECAVVSGNHQRPAAPCGGQDEHVHSSFELVI